MVMMSSEVRDCYFQISVFFFFGGKNQISNYKFRVRLVWILLGKNCKKTEVIVVIGTLIKVIWQNEESD